MIERNILIVLLLFLGCSRADRSAESGVADTLRKQLKSNSRTVTTNEVNTYSAAYVYMDLDSDSLLLQNEDFDNIVPRFLREGKILKEEEYPGDDCSSKCRIFGLNDNLLTIYKYDCGEYGFGNSQYLVRHDSIQKLRNYRTTWNITSKEFELDLTEQIYFWDGKQFTVRERHKVVHDYLDLDLRGIPFKSKIVGTKEYRDLIKEYRQIIK